MKKILVLFFNVSIIFVVCGLATIGWATPIRMNFTAIGFTSLSNTPPPTDPVVGAIEWDAASVDATIDSLTSITMIIDGHTYDIADVGFESPSTIITDFNIIGGIEGGIFGIGSGTDDFWIFWNKNTLQPLQLTYTSSKTNNDIWTTLTFDDFSIKIVPVPTTILLLGSGLVGLVGFRKRFYKS